MSDKKKGPFEDELADFDEIFDALHDEHDDGGVVGDVERAARRSDGDAPAADAWVTESPDSGSDLDDELDFSALGDPDGETDEVTKGPVELAHRPGGGGDALLGPPGGSSGDTGAGVGNYPRGGERMPEIELGEPGATPLAGRGPLAVESFELGAPGGTGANTVEDRPAAAGGGLDEDFYDGIEVSEGSESADPEPVVRRPTVNVVRRPPRPNPSSPPRRPIEVRTRPADHGDSEFDAETRVVAFSRDKLAELRRSRDADEPFRPASDFEPTVDWSTADLDTGEIVAGSVGDDPLLPPPATEEIAGRPEFSPSDEDIDDAIDELFSLPDDSDSSVAEPVNEAEVVELSPADVKTPAPLAETLDTFPPAEEEDDAIDELAIPVMPRPDVIPAPMGMTLDLDDDDEVEIELSPAAGAAEPTAGLDTAGVGDQTVADLALPPSDYLEDDELESLDIGLPPVPLDEADVAPELPPSPFSSDLPELRLGELVIPESAPASFDDRSEEAARDLLIYERELELIDEPVAELRLALEAGRLASVVGDYERAIALYQRARDLDRNCAPAIRGLRAAAIALGDWSQVLAYLEDEMPLASAMEKRSLASLRADLLSALGDADAAASAADELLGEAPSDTRALILRLELAAAEDDRDGCRSALDALARYLSDPQLAGSALLASSVAGGRDPARIEALLERPEVTPSAIFDAAAALSAGGDAQAVAAAWNRVARSPQLMVAEPELAGVLHFRAGREWQRGGNPDRAWESLVSAAELLPYHAATQSAYARACEERGNLEAAAHAFQQLASVAPTDGERAAALLRAAACWSRLAPDDPDALRRADHAALSCYRKALALDPNDRRALSALKARVAGSTAEEIALERVIDESETDESPYGSAHARLQIAHYHSRDGDHEQAAGELVAARSAGAELPVVTRALDRALAYAQRFEERAMLLAEVAESEAEQLAPEVGFERAARAAEDVLNHRLLMEAQADPRDGRQAAREQAVRDALEQALTAWERVSELQPESPAALLARLSLAQRHAYRTGGIESLSRTLAVAAEVVAPPARRIHLLLRRSAILLGQDDDASIAEAEACLDEASSTRPGDLRVSLARMLQSVASENWDDTADILIETAEALGDTAVADSMRFRGAYILLDRVGDAARAVDVVTPMLERRPDFLAAQDLVRSAHRQLGGTAILDPTMSAGATEVDVRRDFGDSFAQLIRQAELLEYRVGDPGRAAAVYRRALELRPGHPVATLGFERAARAAGTVAELADHALAELRAIDSSNTEARARGYEQLAEIDGELRGDAESALFSLRSAVDLEPTYLPALRELERRYRRDGRWDELYGVYGRLIAALGDGPDAAGMALQRARVASLSGHDEGAVMTEYRFALSKAPRCRRALFALEADAHGSGVGGEYAELAAAVAAHFASSPEGATAAASFETRAGDAMAAANDHGAASQHYRVALEHSGGYVPALMAWRRAALAAQSWEEVAVTALRQAELDPEARGGAALLHLAGVALMDRALDGERAADVFVRVLEAEPDHADAFARLRILYDEQARNEDLAALLEARIEHEDDLEGRLELHHAAANLYRNMFEDRGRAVEHLRAMLDLDPDHRGAIADLSDIAWEQGEWTDAAEALSQRARLETSEAALRHIFFRLGTIYADRAPNPRQAIQSFEKVLSYDAGDRQALARLADLYADTGEWGQALEACEKLIKTETDPSAKIDHLHRAARVYVDGFEDAGKAEQALRIALDVDPTSEKAISAVIEFFEVLGDPRGLRVNLDRVAAAMRSRLHKNTFDGLAYRILARIFRRREAVGVRGSLPTAFCAAELAVLLGAAEDSESELATRAQGYRPRATVLAGSDVDDYLFPRAVAPGLRELYRLLSDRIANRVVGIDLKRYGVGRSDRLSAGNPAVQILQEVANELKMGEVAVYVSRSQPTVSAAEPTSPVSLIIGEALLTPDKPKQLRFLAGRELKLCKVGLAAPSRMSPKEFGLVTAGLVRQFQPDFMPRGLSPAEVSAATQQHKRLIPGKLQQELANFAVGISAAAFDAQRVWSGIGETGTRAGLLVCASARAAVEACLAMGGYRDIHSAARDASIVQLMRFAVSEDYTVMRAALDR